MTGISTLQQKSVSGKVTDESGTPLPGVTVVVKGTTQGTVTDNDGTYSLSNIPEEAILLFSFVGMRPQEASVGSQTQINVKMHEEAIGLSEVVAVGYGTQRKVNLTGSVGRIDPKEFETRPITNVTQALQGKVPGLLVNQTGGQPGGEQFKINIRGVSTFSNNDPLIIVDGIAMSLVNLNPQDIESISVLKDAASAAIYGARASGGVILVTTKKGSVGKTKISYDAYYGIQTPTMLPDMVNAYEHVMLYREAEYNANPETTVYKYTLEEMEAYKRGELPETDRVDYLFNSASQHNHNLSISGGSEINQYLFSVGVTSQNGTLRNTSSNRYNFRLNNNIRVSKRFNINLNVQYAPTRRHQMSEATYPSGPTRGLSDIIYNAAFRRGADDFIFTSDGRWASVTGWANRIGLASKDGGFQERDLNRFTGVVTFDYKLSPSLSLNGMYGGKYDHTRQIDYSKRMQFINPADLTTVDFDYNINSLLIYNQDNYQHNTQLLLNYNKEFGGIHEIKGLLGFSQEWNTDTWERVGRRNFVTDDIYVINAGSSDPSVWTTAGSASEWALRSYFGRLNYSLKNRYLFESTMRYDGSSRFSENKRWGFFPSFSLV
ncbi:MAG: SusC/RagA family TonB-linked outer membrane protein [Draconibacterium sp.]